MTRHGEKGKDVEVSLTADLRNGDKEQVLRKLQTEGVRLEQFVRIGKEDVLTEQVAGAIHFHTLFSSPEEQIARMLELNEKVWKNEEITEENIRKIGPAPICPAPIRTETEARFYCLFLHYEFYDDENYKVRPLKNFWRYWQALETIYGIEGISFDGHSSKPRRVTTAEKKSLIFSEGAFDSHQGGFYWYVVEFGYRFLDQPFEEAKKSFREQNLWALGHEILAIFLMHPRWVEHFNPRIIPEKAAYEVPFGFGKMAPLDLTLVSSNSRSYPTAIFRIDKEIRFNTTAGVRRCLIPYVVKRVPSMGWEFMFPKNI